LLFSVLEEIFEFENAANPDPFALFSNFTASMILGIIHRVPTPSLLPLLVAKAGRIHLNEEITPLLPTGIGEQYTVAKPYQT
jgi:hypothetical protein